MNDSTTTLQTATFAAGCFWGVEETFRNVPGVKWTQVGYTGGTTDSPTYKEVCSGRTGHAEAVQLTFDPGEVTYERLLDVFWNSHNPTSRNRQGWDIGSQYRSAIFYHSPEQESVATRSKEARQGKGFFARKIATEIMPVGPFYRAEEYHQQYIAKRHAPAGRAG